jgi:uncharacterized protein (TIGR02246 family)
MSRSPLSCNAIAAGCLAMPPPPRTCLAVTAAVTAALRRLGLRLAALTISLQMLIGAALPVAALAEAPPATTCAPISERQVAALFERWNDALASGDPNQVASLYSDDALLLPTLSAEPRRTHAAIRDYFNNFLARAPRGRIDSRTIRLGCNSALDAGTYSFLLRDPADSAGAGGEQWVKARYSFVYSFSPGTGSGDAPGPGEWLILHHHSSLQPQA